MSLEAFIFICISGYLQMYECFFYSLNSGKCIIFVCLVPAGPVVEHIVQLIQLAVELIIGEECVTTDTAVVVPVCLVDKAFGWTFVPWLDRVDDS